MGQGQMAGKHSTVLVTGATGNQAEIHSDRRASESVQRALSRMDRDLLDADERDLRQRDDQRQDTRASESR